MHGSGVGSLRQRALEYAPRDGNHPAVFADLDPELLSVTCLAVREHGPRCCKALLMEINALDGCTDQKRDMKCLSNDMRFALFAVMLAVTGCVVPTTLATKPADGYPALRFTETVRFTCLVGNTWEFQAGTMPIGDRRRDSDGQLLYCGSMVVRDLAGENRPVCVIKHDNQLVILLSSLTSAERDIPPGAIEEVRSR
jgi:hypothetical protein